MLLSFLFIATQHFSSRDSRDSHDITARVRTRFETIPPLIFIRSLVTCPHFLLMGDNLLFAPPPAHYNHHNAIFLQYTTCSLFSLLTHVRNHSTLWYRNDPRWIYSIPIPFDRWLQWSNPQRIPAAFVANSYTVQHFSPKTSWDTTWHNPLIATVTPSKLNESATAEKKSIPQRAPKIERTQ